MALVYIVEDDRNIREIETFALRNTGYEVMGFECAKDFYKEMENRKPDIILLDIMLPDEDGLEIVRKLRAIAGTRGIPVIMVTAKASEIDKVKGLDMGADDYVTKPFKAGILLSRIRAVLRRQEKFSEAEDTLFCGNIVLDKRKTTVTAGGEKVELTAGEFRLLAYLMENKNRTLTRNALLSRLWDDEGDYVNDNTLTVTVGRLREKLGEQSRRFLKTVRGIGYHMEDCGD